MKTENFKHSWPAFAHERRGRRLCAAVMAVSLLIAGNLKAMPVVQTVSGGPSYGYVDGNTKSNALFHTPIGLAFGSDPAAGRILYVADRDNNAIRKLDLDLNQTITFATNGINRINQPVGVALDGDGNLYVLNRGNGNNGTVLKFNRFGNLLGTNAAALINANGIALDGATNIYVTVNGNAVIKISPGSFPGVKTNVATINIANTSLQGVAVTSSGYLAVCDSGRHGIWMINPTDGTKFQLTGFHGPGDTFGARESAQFNQPYGIAAAGGGMLVVTDYGNHRVKTVDSQGTVSSLYGVCASDWNVVPGDPSVLPGWWDGNGCPSETTCQTCDNFAEARWPKGVVVAPNGDVYTTEVYYHLIRHTTATGLAGPQPGSPPLSPSFNGPMGIALDTSGIGYMFIADQMNNAVQLLNFGDNSTTTFLSAGDGIDRPVDVKLDSSDFLFVLNQGTNGNGYILEFDPWGFPLGTVAAGLTNPTALALDGAGNIFVAEQTGAVKKFVPGVSSNTIATITNVGVNLQGIGLFDDGTIAVSDAGNHVMWQINPLTTAVSRLTGQLGLPGSSLGTTNSARLNQPHKLARAGGNRLVAADYGNNRLVVVERSGWITNRTILISTNSLVWFGQPGDPVAPGSPNWVPMILPVAVAVGAGGAVYSSEILTNDCIRKILNAGVAQAGPLPPGPPAAPNILTVTTNYGQVTLSWTTVAGATNYIVRRSTSSGEPYTIITNTTATSYTDTSVTNGTTYYYVVSASNAGGEGHYSAEVSATPPIPPPLAPRIGWFEYVGTAPPLTVLHPVSGANFYTAHNDLLIAVDPTISGISTYYTIDSSDPRTSGSRRTPPPYQDGWLYAQPLSGTTGPDLVIKAVNVGPGGTSSVTTAEFIFQVALPAVIGNNAAQFTVSDITDGAGLWYSTDDTDPTNAAPSQFAGTIIGTNSITLHLSFPAGATNMTFKVRGFKANYQPSESVPQPFSTTNLVLNSISFGFASGEASSDFVASPGQLFYAPVTLGVLPTTRMYSLQFNVTVTNLASAPPIPGELRFASMLEKPDLGNPGFFLRIPPAMFVNYTTNPPVLVNGILVTNLTPNFTNLVFASANLLGVGWLERAGHTNLYDTKSQDLIKYSQPHDTLFDENNGKVVAGGYAFRVPGAAAPGDQYKIQIGRPSATSDGVGGPGSDVFITTPTNGSLTNGAINSIKLVTVGQRKYIAGDAYPFRWFNAGDFGDTNLNNADVEQVFEAAIYNFNNPPAGSDFFDSMDSCGVTYIDNGNGYLEQNTLVPNPNLLFDGNDTTINQVAFGDGYLDVCDVYVTFRRSLDPSLTYFRRFWTNGVLVAETTTNEFRPLALGKTSLDSGPQKQSLDGSNSITNQPKVNFTAGDVQGLAGQVVQIPITAQVFGSYPLRVLMLNLSVDPLDGSPALTTAVQFTPSAALGQPALTSSKGNGNYAAVWLDNTIGGITNLGTIGTLTITIPATATGNSTYAIHFDHASGSPNGIASFPEKTQTGLITLSSRTNSTYGDGIPDSWRLRYFGTVNNLLSQASADADGDGMNNLQEYIAGTDPLDPKSNLRVGNGLGANQAGDCAIHWPSVFGKQYVIERSANLFAPAWTPVSTNNGTGTEMEIHDSSGGNTRFYRVRVLP